MKNEPCECQTEDPERRELGLTINDHGMREEFHQKEGNGYMFAFHKERRLELIAEYRRRYEGKRVNCKIK